MRILVTGAGGVVGRPLAERCEGAGLDVVRSGRSKRARGWLAWDMAASPLAFDDRLDCVVHTAPLWVLPDHVEALAGAGVARLVAFSSTSALTKGQSASSAERALAASLNRAEARLWEETSRLGVDATIFRPTMVYGYGRDENISAIAQFVRRYGFFAVAGPGSGGRQPVHADDLAAAAVSVLDKAGTFGGTYNLAGGEILTYRAMVVRVFEGLRRPVRIVTVPTGLYKGLLGMAGMLKKGITPSMAARMNQDMVFDSSDARTDFRYDPQAFLEHPERDLPAP